MRAGRFLPEGRVQVVLQVRWEEMKTDDRSTNQHSDDRFLGQAHVEPSLWFPSGLSKEGVNILKREEVVREGKEYPDQLPGLLWLGHISEE